jgi:four helix bundle protein
LQGNNCQGYVKVPQLKFQIRKSKNQEFKDKNKMNSYKPYDLGDRTFLFALNVAKLVNKIPKTISNIEYSKQVIKSSGSVGANYIEANENLGEKDAIYRFKVCRKETKESAFWLRLLKAANKESLHTEFDEQINEANELKMIFNAIVNNKSVK